MVKHLILSERNLKYDGYQCVIASMTYRCFDKKTSATRTNKFDGSRTKNENKSHKELAKELLFKPTIKKIQKRKVHSSFADNIWGC